MYKLFATIKKDLLLLFRDKIGLLFMFIMPVILALLITAVQNSTFDLVNNNKLQLVISNIDSGDCSRKFIEQIKQSGIFNVTEISKNTSGIKSLMHKKNALVGVLIPADFSVKIRNKSEALGNKILKDLGVSDVADSKTDLPVALEIYYSPVLQESFRVSIRAAINGAIQVIENKQMLRSMYASLNEKADVSSLEKELMSQQHQLNEITVTQNGSQELPNATQHNIPAWTVFAMFFVVISLGSNVVKEKLNGSFIRLKISSSSYLISLISKQITYLGVTLCQAILIFILGVYLFPKMGLPKLVILEGQVLGLLIISLLAGWCAVSFAICIGIFSRTQEQSNGLGAVLVVILAAIGGILVPSFVMPEGIKTIMGISPLHWCLESYYALFLHYENIKDIFVSIIPILLMILIFQLIALWGLKRKNLI